MSWGSIFVEMANVLKVNICLTGQNFSNRSIFVLKVSIYPKVQYTYVLKVNIPMSYRSIFLKSDTKKGSFFELLSVWAYVVLVSLNSLVASVQYVIVMALHGAQVREPKKSVSRSC